MKLYIFSAVFSVLCLIMMPNFGWSSEWDKFTDYLSEYYYLDGEQFNEITCEIYPSATKSLTSNIQRDIEYQNLGLEIIENANDFKFTRKNTGEISFQKPEFDIRIPQPYYHQNIEEIEKWVNDVKSYYVQTIESVSVAAGAFFNFLKKPGKDDLKLVLFEEINNGVVATYEEDSNLTTRTCTNNDCVFESNVGVFTYIVTVTYKETKQGKIPIKMVLKGLKSGQSVAEAETTISYQKVGNLLMPEKINSYDKYSEGNGTIESRGETLFKNCVVN